ncbi:PD-(D/E)XK nuclease-like domain-containing protein [Cereibacter sphaeroides]|nr:PD-(D/E)XK nuclease-like domain-containing protein [Cereibacter sphaeroides]
MTHHALERLAERFHRIEPKAALKEILDAIDTGTAHHAAASVTGEKIVEVMLTSWEVAFALICADGSIKTVLSEGMETNTTTGRLTLLRQGLPSGVHQLDGDEYHMDPCRLPSLSSTLAKKMLAQSPLHAWTDSARLNPDWQPTDKKTFDIGRAAHRAILGRGSDFAAIPESLLASNGAASTKEAKAFIEDCRSRGITPLKTVEVEEVGSMATKMAARLELLNITFDPANSEIAALAQIGETWCRMMADNAPIDDPRFIYDLKTCESAAPEACQRAVMNYGYDVQAAHYLETWRAATGENRKFRFVFQEKSAPYEICVVELGEDTLSMASRKIARARETWAHCLKSGNWPGYPLGVQQIELPEWFHERWSERESVAEAMKRATPKETLAAARQWQAPVAAE